MAVGTTAVDREHDVRAPHHGLMPLLRVAALAKLRAPHGKQPLIVRPMRGVAIDAILPNRGVLPQKRASLLLVARVTLFIH